MAAAEYTILLLNPSGVVDTSLAVRFPDDAAALAHARALHHTGRVEVWAGKREVGVVPPAIKRPETARTRRGDR